MNTESLLEQARLGCPAAIATLINRTLSKRGARARAKVRSGQFEILLEAPSTPKQQPTVEWLVKGLSNLSVSGFETVTIYGRAQGQTQPDWQQTVPLVSFTAPIPPNETPPDETPPNETETPAVDPAPDLTQYCFVRNLSLLTIELLAPTSEIAQLVNDFHALSPAEKLSVLPGLDLAFRSPEKVTTDGLSPNPQVWLQQLLEIEPSSARKASIWLSRYCHNPEATVEQVSRVLTKA
ncbi:hypothetical protein IQ241_19040 [Romeria aff. gracilis LEGE 07310]|uniref:Uncharacterized protein n=1 Tax=Vasconcelosia minhoensis LEGE 07310 TaxID=915328 RepID=A0A8J7ARR3_9CYAN|nr:hypothetical protein [Romeria gracilis]MBE9079366.1 hypothetical protein [Romeria aff. gracilis LEGE 07310]